jgi:hypothetical protein
LHFISANGVVATVMKPHLSARRNLGAVMALSFGAAVDWSLDRKLRG